MQHLRSLSLLLLLVLFTACGTPATPGTENDAARAIVTWYQYDQNNEDPASDERVGNEYLRNMIPQFNAEFADKWQWVNQPKAFDKMATELIAAVQAGGEIPDVMQVHSSDFLAFYQNGTLQDLTEWAAAQPWFADLDDNAVEVCKGPDGALYCIPIAQMPQVVFVWNDHFPDGYPTTPEAFMSAAESLKEQGLYAITFFGSTDFAGDGAARFIYMAIRSFGGSYDDGKGNLTLNTPENIAAVTFLREIVAKGYVPEVAFAGQFQEEQAFKDASAASFPTGIFGYRYINPLTAPNGNSYTQGNEEDMLNAIAVGDVYLAPLFAADGAAPGCHVGVTGLAIPTDAANLEGAKAYINWIMSAEQNAGWVLGPGGGFPTLQATQQDEVFQTPFFQQAADVVAASDCRPWYGSLTRRDEALRLIMDTIYTLIKADPTADIATALAAADAEYNRGN